MRRRLKSTTAQIALANALAAATIASMLDTTIAAPQRLVPRTMRPRDKDIIRDQAAFDAAQAKRARKAARK